MIKKQHTSVLSLTALPDNSLRHCTEYSKHLLKMMCRMRYPSIIMFLIIRNISYAGQRNY